MPLDLSVEYNRIELARRILADIDQWCIDTMDDGPRSHLGASVIGAECTRQIQYSFRWFDYKVAHGRMQRLWNRGHLEEHRFVSYLRGIGFTIWQFEDAEGRKQFRCKSIGGHFGGSLDGINQAPPRYDLTEQMLCEFKTNGTGSGFNKLKEKGVKFAKPQHYTQMCTYGKFYGLRYALYMNVNKNDDDIHVEIVPLDWSYAEDYQRKAEKIIRATQLMAKTSMSPAHMTCKMCDFVGVCHENHAPLRNCRSCKNSIPVDGGEWKCSLNSLTIPKDFIKVGCSSWQEFGK